MMPLPPAGPAAKQEREEQRPIEDSDHCRQHRERSVGRPTSVVPRRACSHTARLRLWPGFCERYEP